MSLIGWRMDFCYGICVSSDPSKRRSGWEEEGYSIGRKFHSVCAWEGGREGGRCVISTLTLWTTEYY